MAAQIVLGILVAAVVGVVAHVVLPGRGERGVALAPLVAAAVGALAWTALTWAGLGIDSVWMWLAAVLAPAVVTVPFVLALAAVRRRSDAAERARLRIT